MRPAHRRIIESFLAGAIAGVAGCAWSDPEQRAVEAQRTILRAEKSGAEQLPEAALYLHFAREESAHARELIDNPIGDWGAARSLLLRACADARLAEGLARSDGERTRLVFDRPLAFDSKQQKEE